MAMMILSASVEIFSVSRMRDLKKREIWTFSFQSCVCNKFFIVGSGQTEKARIWSNLTKCAFFHIEHFLKSKTNSENRFELRCSYFHSKTKLECVDQWKKFHQKWISHCIFKSCSAWARVFFMLECNNFTCCLILVS